MHLKFVDGSDTEIEGLLVPYGGPMNGRDVQGEYFSAKTDLCLSWFPNQTRPLLFHHGMDPAIEAVPVGQIKAITQTDKGHWIRAWLDKSHEYYSAVQELITEKAAGLSSGAMPHLVKVTKAGEITRWPLVEGSITPTPANTFATVDFAKAVNHFKSAGIDLDVDALKAKLTAEEENDLADADFAYVGPDGTRKLPIHDAEHVRNALARFNQTEFPSDAAKETARTNILARAKKLGVDVSEDSGVGGGKSWDLLTDVPLDQWTGIKLYQDGTYVATKAMEGSYEDLLCDLEAMVNPVTPYADCTYSCILGTFDGYLIVRRYEQDPDSDFRDVDETYWRVEYSLNDDGDPMLGAASQVDQTFVPQKSFLSDSPLSIDASALARHAEALCARTKGLHERRIKEGRVLSSVNRQRLTDAVKALETVRTELVALLAASDQLLSDQAKATALMQPESLRDRLALLELFEQTL